MPLNETEGYVKDQLGLRTLDEQGKLILNAYPEGHLGYQMDWWINNIAPLLGTPEESANFSTSKTVSSLNPAISFEKGIAVSNSEFNAKFVSEKHIGSESVPKKSLPETEESTNLNEPRNKLDSINSNHPLADESKAMVLFV